MTNLKSHIQAALLCVMGTFCAATPAMAEGSHRFFDTGAADKFISVGVRAGLNTSDRTVGKDAFSGYNNCSWGTGIDLGAVANLNIRDFLTIQPGIFYQTRSGHFALEEITNFQTNESYIQLGRYRSYEMYVPLMAVIHLNLASSVKWNLEGGVYWSFRLRTDADEINVSKDPAVFTAAVPHKTDFGLKFGTSLNLLRHWYVGVHYMAGTTHAWKNGIDGRNKCWEFTLGYDF